LIFTTPDGRDPRGYLPACKSVDVRQQHRVWAISIAYERALEWFDPSVLIVTAFADAFATDLRLLGTTRFPATVPGIAVALGRVFPAEKHMAPFGNTSRVTLDRRGRSLLDLVTTLQELHHCNGSQ
jgi:hypothetical protein